MRKFFIFILLLFTTIFSQEIKQPSRLVTTMPSQYELGYQAGWEEPSQDLRILIFSYGSPVLAACCIPGFPAIGAIYGALTKEMPKEDIEICVLSAFLTTSLHPFVLTLANFLTTEGPSPPEEKTLGMPESYRQGYIQGYKDRYLKYIRDTTINTWIVTSGVLILATVALLVR